LTDAQNALALPIYIFSLKYFFELEFSKASNTFIILVTFFNQDNNVKHTFLAHYHFWANHHSYTAVPFSQCLSTLKFFYYF